MAAYAAGRRAEAIAALGEWTEDELEMELALLDRLSRTAQDCRGNHRGNTASLVAACAARARFEQLPLRAAVMLHTDRESFERTPKSPETALRCGVLVHGRKAERLAEFVLLQPNGPEFVRRFYLAAALQAHTRGCFLDARRWSRVGLRRFPKDALLNLALGTTTESVAFVTPPPRSLRPNPTTAQVKQAQGAASQYRDLWEESRRAFEEAVGADPSLDEAGLRLGRVLLRLEKNERARALFEAILARSTDPQLRYLAHLFLGRIHEQAGRAREADAKYGAALAILPASQVAAVAVAHLRETQGQVAEARDVLERALAHTRKRTVADPYWEYYMVVRTVQAEAILEALRKETPQ